MKDDSNISTCYYLIACQLGARFIISQTFDTLSDERRSEEVERELKARRVILVRQNIGESVNDDMIEIMMINMIISQLFWVVIAEANILNNLFPSLVFISVLNVTRMFFNYAHYAHE